MTDELKVLRQFLATDPRDVGCEAAMEILHVYAERVLAGEDPERTMPGVAAHLGSCGPCDADLRGLVEALRAAATSSVRTPRGPEVSDRGGDG